VLKTPAAAGVEIFREFAATDGVQGHPQVLRLVMVELLRNAVDALQAVDKPAIWLRTTGNGSGSVVAEVEDNGRGLDEEAKAALFQPFTTRKLSGLGIGLAFARRAVLLHGGDIQLLPGSKGGTCVRVTLPVGTPAKSG
jgi:two-component system sensor kinase FixL